MDALLKNGFEVPETLRRPTNLDASKFYDQIAFKTKPQVLDFENMTGHGMASAGVFDIFQSVLGDDSADAYTEDVSGCTCGKNAETDEKLTAVYHQWRTFQLSDHKPMWVRLNTNDSTGYLERLWRRCSSE